MNIYFGTFLIAAATLALEITFTRLLSVVTWYHLAFFAVGTAMLGMTAGATTVYLNPRHFAPKVLGRTLAWACLGYALAVPVSLLLLCRLEPLQFQHPFLTLLALLEPTAACALPFYFSGLAVSAVLTRCPLPIGRLYAADLLGASLGCLVVLAGLERFDAPSLILLCGAIGGTAAVYFAWDGRFRATLAAAVALVALLAAGGLANSHTPYGMRPRLVKGKVEDPRHYALEKWNSFSRVALYKLGRGTPFLWGPSPHLPKDQQVYQYLMNIDGDAGTTIRKFQSLEDISHLRYDVTNIAYYLRPKGGACIIGCGGGKDVQSAILFGHDKVTGLDINPIFINLLQKDLRDFAGLGGRPGVTLIADEARSVLSRTTEHYALIQMSLVDTWAATGAGAFSLSENGLYTVEAWQIFFERLAPDGIFTVSRWYSPSDLGETGRLVSLAVGSLLEAGVREPDRHVALVTCDMISTLLLSKSPFTAEDISRLQAACAELAYDLPVVPGVAPANEVLRAIVAANSLPALNDAIKDRKLNYKPPTDDSPYFFNMLRRDSLRYVFLVNFREMLKPSALTGVAVGNMLATLTLTGLILCLLLAAGVTIVLPLLVRLSYGRARDNPGKLLWSAAAYFSLIGAGFMFVEIGLIQRLSVFLGHPAYALGILLFTMIASAGVGSYVSELLPLTRRPWVYLYPWVIAAMIVVVRYLLPVLGSRLVTAGMAVKILAAIAVIAPLGVLLGVCFPTGMRLVQSVQSGETPWYWALNGIFGVLCSALTVFISIYYGISTSFHLAAVCYILLVFFLPSMCRAGLASRATPAAAGGCHSA